MARERLLEHLDRRFDDLENAQRTWRRKWRDMSTYVLPRTGRYLSTDLSSTPAGGSPDGSYGTNSRDDDYGGDLYGEIIDGTAGYAVQTVSSGLMGGVTNPSWRWFALEAPDIGRRTTSQERKWVAKVETMMREMFIKSNLYKVLPRVYEDLALYGTSAFGAFDDDRTDLRFEYYPVGSYLVQQNHKLVIDTFFRTHLQTLGQIVHEYCETEGEVDPVKLMNLSRAARDSWEEGRLDRKYQIIECILPSDPRAFLDQGTLTAKDINGIEYPYVHLIYQRSTEERNENSDTPRILHKGGFRQFPVMVPRWHVNPPDTYGHSPGETILGDAKQLQAMWKTMNMAMEKLVDPPMVAPSDLDEGQNLSMDAGQTIFVKGNPAKERDLVRPAYTFNPELGSFHAIIEDTRQKIRLYMYTDLFLSISQMDRDVTATQIRAMQDEKFAQLGPVMMTLDDDILKPLVSLAFARIVGLEEGQVPLVEPPPQGLLNVDLNARYTSLIAMALLGQIRENTHLFESFVADTAARQYNMGQMDTVADILDDDKVIRGYAKQMGIDPELLRSERHVEEIRAMRAQAQQAQMERAQVSQDIDDEAKLAKTGSIAEGLANQGGIVRP